MQGGGGGAIRWIDGPEVSRGDVETTFRVMLPRSYSAEGIVVSIEDGYGAVEDFSDASTASRYASIEPWSATRDGQLYQVTVTPRQSIRDYTYMCVYHWDQSVDDFLVVAGCNTVGAP